MEASELVNHFSSFLHCAVERDVFDKLFDEAPEKLEPVKRVGIT